MRSLLLSLPLLVGCVESASPDEVGSIDCAALRDRFETESGTALAAADDGHLFLAGGETIARLEPDGAIDVDWQRADGVVFDDLAATSTRLYATARGAGVVAFDLAGPAGQPGDPVLGAGVASFGITGDGAGGLYLTRDDAPTIARLWPGGALLTDVTTAPLPGPIGDLVVDADGALLVILMFGGDVYRIEVDGSHREVARTRLARTGLPFALTLDVDDAGRLYYGGQGALYRLAPPYQDGAAELLAAGVDGLAKVEVGRGDACPGDVYASARPGLAIAAD